MLWSLVRDRVMRSLKIAVIGERSQCLLFILGPKGSVLFGAGKQLTADD